jgi:hypothetical protein
MIVGEQRAPTEALETITEIQASSGSQSLQVYLSAIWCYPPSDPEALDTLGYYLEMLQQLEFRSELTVVATDITSEAAADVEKVLLQHGISGRVLNLHRDCDESTAIQVGMSASHGELIALLPSYLQSDPANFGSMVAEIDRADYVASWRSPRIDTRRDAFSSSIFNIVTRKLTGVPLHDINSGLRLMKREVAESVPIYGDLHRFLPVLAWMQGYRVTEVKTRHLNQRINEGSGVYVRRVLDMLTLFFLLKFSRKPLRFFGLIGTTTLMAGTLLTCVVSVQRFFGVALSDRPVFLLGILLVVLGVQLFSLGLLGELIIFTHGRKLRNYHVARIHEHENG